VFPEIADKAKCLPMALVELYRYGVRRAAISSFAPLPIANYSSVAIAQSNVECAWLTGGKAAMEVTDVAADCANGPIDNHAISDRELLNRFRQGDREAAAQLYQRYADRLRALTRRKSSTALACRLDPDDIVQSVFRNFFHAARDGGYEVPPGEDLWKLLLVIALNKIRARGTFHRAAKRDVRRTRRIEGLDPYTLAKENPHGQAGQTLLRLVAEEALGRLPSLQRTIVKLRVEGYQVHEIAKLTGRSLRTVERTLQNCRKHLAQFLHDHEPAAPPDACTVG
jgi:RNA polymerase sigma-70 factor (ECF subfamily)